VTLTQLTAFVYVARLGSVKAAASALGVSEPAISQALAALRVHLGDPLLTRNGDRMTPTEGGRRLLGIASQMIALSAEAESAVRATRMERLHVVATSPIAEFVTTSLTEVFGRRKTMDASCGDAVTVEIPLLLTSRVADVALGPQIAGKGLVSVPVLRCRLIAVGGHGGRRDTWLVDPSVADPRSDTSRLLDRLRVPESRVQVFPNQTAAWDAAAEGAGIALAIGHLVAHQVQRKKLTVVETSVTPMDVSWHATTLEPGHRPATAASFLDFLSTPVATQLMRSPQAGVPRSRFRPPVHVSIWKSTTPR
jgi:LysR family transcriptional regulator, low CO2-responsive transcriptional regulator